MIDVADLKILVSNVLSENQYKHCRLCLKEIQGAFLKFDYLLHYIDESSQVQTLRQILCEMVGNEICEEIIGVDAVCGACANMTMKCIKFIDTCKRSTKLLNRIFDNITESLIFDIGDVNSRQKLYVVVGEEESKVVLVSDETEITPKEQFFCEACNENFDNLESLQEHCDSVHIPLTCEICQEQFSDETKLSKHKKSGHAFECAKCGQLRCSEESLNHHIDKTHTVHICKECGKACHGLDKLCAHEDKHESKNDCPNCGKTYLTKCFYEKHVKLCVAGQIDPHPYRGKCSKEYQCHMCPKAYSTPGGLKVHERFEHGDATYHICEICDKKFTARSYLKLHMIKHTGERNFDCTICKKKFVTKEALLYHTRRHTGDKPYSCDLCQERFVNASGRAEHIKFKHSGPKLTCDICDRKYFTTSFLKKHQKRHEDPTSKLYVGRMSTPADIPGGNNIRTINSRSEIQFET